jgi:glycosyltransferase involved in cell wall biosynthesis
VRNILVVYGLMQHPLRSTVEDHLYSFRRYSEARVFYANALVGPVPRWMRRIAFDAIVFHTTFLSSLRWGPEVDATLRARALELDGVSGIRAAMPQDEFLRSGALCNFIRDARVDVVFSVSPASEWPKIYADVERDRVRFEPTLTGYLDERTMRRIDGILRETPERPTDVFYRAGAERPYLGRHGLLKTSIATAGEAEATARGMTTDISLDPVATLLGDDWFQALARSRWTLGVEGGASILDPEGAIRAATMRYVAEHPDATYDEIEAACFPGRDGELSLFAISPRHLEACATRTGQILVEGAYSDVLEPGRHYLPLKADLSNLGDLLEQAKDEDLRRRLTEAAYRDVVSTGRYTYRGFVEHVDGVLLAGPPRRAGAVDGLAERAARVHDWLSWRRVAWRLKRGHVYRFLGRLRALTRRPPRAAEPTVVSVTPLRLDADSRTLKEAVSLARTGLRSIVVERLASTETWDDVPIEVVSMAAPSAPPSSANGAATRPAPPKPRPTYLLVKPFLPLLGPWLGLAMTTRDTLAKLPPADLYWVHSVPQLPAVAFRARRLGVPFVYDAHDFYSDSKHNDGLRWTDRWGMWVYEKVERFFVRFAAERVTVGIGVKELQERHFGRAFEVLHNAHDLRLDRTAQANVRQALELGDDAFLIVAAGNSKEGTSFEPIFDALAALPEHVHLTFVGRNYEGPSALARARGIDGRVHFLPPVPPAEVKSFIAGADAAAILYWPITSNFLNALPNRLYQAIAAGLPLLYPESMRAIRALCEEYDVGVAIDPRDADSVLAGIRRLLDEPAELDRLRANARQAARQVNWEQEEAKLNALVRDLIAR